VEAKQIKSKEVMKCFERIHQGLYCFILMPPSSWTISRRTII